RCHYLGRRGSATSISEQPRSTNSARTAARSLAMKMLEQPPTRTSDSHWFLCSGTNLSLRDPRSNHSSNLNDIPSDRHVFREIRKRKYSPSHSFFPYPCGFKKVFHKTLRTNSSLVSVRSSIFYYSSGMSCGAPPHLIPIPPPLDERKIHHTPSRYTA